MELRVGLALLLVSFNLLVFPSFGHGPTPQKVEETIVIAASPDAVWAAVKDFGSIAEWNPLVANSIGRGGNLAGAERDIVFKAGGQVTDSLDEYIDDEKTYSYRLGKPNVDAFPVSFYSATLEVKPAAEGAEVTWVARFYRADTGNFPPEDKNDQAAIAAMTAFFQAGLQELKKKLENRQAR